MVKTTTGAVDTPPNEPGKAKLTAEDKKMERTLQLDDATWGRIESQAVIQSTTPSEVIRSAIEQNYGHDPVTEGFNH